MSMEQILDITDENIMHIIKNDKGIKAGYSQSLASATKIIEEWYGEGCATPENAQRLLDMISEDDEEEETKKSRKSVATKIVELAQGNDIFFFRDNGNVIHAWLKLEDHREIWRVESTVFKEYLRRIYFNSTGLAAATNAIKDAADTLSAINHDAPVYKLYNRVAWHDNAIWYDMTDDKWRTIRIGTDGWAIMDTTPVPIFRRIDHQIPQVEPIGSNSVAERRETIWKLFNFHNIKGLDEGNRLLDVAHIITAFVPDIPHTISFVFGPAGSGKTKGFHRQSQLLIDPSNIKQGLDIPGKTRVSDIILHLDRHYYLVYSNVSWLTREVSDILCRAVDGTGSEVRKLYHDDVMMSYRYQRCIAVNSIPLIAVFEDIIDRGLLFETTPLENRISDKELFKLFETVRPYILGAMFDTLVDAMKIHPTIHIEPERMADFTIWGCAITNALGMDQETFLKAYAENRKIANQEIIFHDDVARSIMEWMQATRTQEGPDWTGTTAALMGDLETFVFGDKKGRPQGWPKDIARMGTKLRRIEQPLARAGIYIIRPNRNAKERTITISFRKQEKLFDNDSNDSSDSNTPQKVVQNSGNTKEGGKSVLDATTTVTTVITVTKSDTMITDWPESGLGAYQPRDKETVFKLLEADLIAEVKPGGPYILTEKGLARNRELKREAVSA